MVEPIFDKVLVEHVVMGTVAVTAVIILALYAMKGLCSYLSTTLVAAAGQGRSPTCATSSTGTSSTSPSPSSPATAPAR